MTDEIKSHPVFKWVGETHQSDAFSAFCDEHGLPRPKKGKYGWDGGYDDVKGISTNFDYRSNTIVGMTVMRDRKQPDIGYHGPLPFGLTFETDREEIEIKLGAPLFVSKHPRGDDVGLQFVLGTFQAWINVCNHRLADMSVSKLTPDLNAMHTRLTQGQAHKNSELDPANIDDIMSFKHNLPTTSWRDLRQESGEDVSDVPTEAQMEYIDQTLNHFIDAVGNAVLEQNANNLLQAVKTAVLAINTLNAEADKSGHEYPIETMERDDLGMFMDEVVQASGYKPEQNDDITSPWREW